MPEPFLPDALEREGNRARWRSRAGKYGRAKGTVLKAHFEVATQEAGQAPPAEKYQGGLACLCLSSRAAQKLEAMQAKPIRTQNRLFPSPKCKSAYFHSVRGVILAAIA